MDCRMRSSPATSGLRESLLLLINLPFGFLNLQDLARVSGDDLVFNIRCHDLDRDVLEAGKEQPFSHLALQEQVLLSLRQEENLGQKFDRIRRLLEENLD